MVSLRGTEVVAVSVKDAILRLRTVPLDSQYIETARMVGTSFGAGTETIKSRFVKVGVPLIMQVYGSQIKTIDPQILCTAYCNGYFPMSDSRTGEISWYSPDPRTIFDLDEFHIPRSLKQTLKKNEFEVHINYHPT